MEFTNQPPDVDPLVPEATRTQLEHFQQADGRCRAVQLPEGIMLRYNLAQALYFYLRTGVAEGQLRTRVYATDSPYDRQKTDIGEVATPMLQPDADETHLQRLERLLRAWVDFVKDEPDPDQPFTSFPVRSRTD
jgi:hypothetical protein